MYVDKEPACNSDLDAPSVAFTFESNSLSLSSLVHECEGSCGGVPPGMSVFFQSKGSKRLREREDERYGKREGEREMEKERGREMASDRGRERCDTKLGDREME